MGAERSTWCFIRTLPKNKCRVFCNMWLTCEICRQVYNGTFIRVYKILKTVLLHFNNKHCQLLNNDGLHKDCGGETSKVVTMTFILFYRFETTPYALQYSISVKNKNPCPPYHSELHNVTVIVEFWDVKTYMLVDKYEEICWCHR
jgi:hypothetical protein